MNSAPTSGLSVITNGSTNTFLFEGDHTISDSFSISKNGVPLFTVSPTGIIFNVSLNNISVQQLTYLLHITSDVQTQLNELLNTLNNDVATLNNTITSNYNTLKHTITSNYDALNNTKQDKGNYVTIDANNTITLSENVTFCTLTPTELQTLKGVSSNVQTQLDSKQESGDYVTTSTLEIAEADLQAEIAASAATITTAYTAADVVIASAAAAS